MSKFIKLTNYCDGRNVYLNVDKIVTITTNIFDEVYIQTEHQSIMVKEKEQEVINLINN